MKVVKAVVFGRDPACDVVIDDDYLSGRHLRMTQYENGAVTADDLGTTNGVFVNGRRIYTETRVVPGDVIRIGRTVLPWKVQ